MTYFDFLLFIFTKNTIFFLLLYSIQNESSSSDFLHPFSLSFLYTTVTEVCQDISGMLLKVYFFRRFTRSLAFDFNYPKMFFMTFFSFLMHTSFFSLPL